MKLSVERNISRTTATIPDDLADLVEGAVRAGIFENNSGAIRHVLREWFEENVRIAAAISLYEAEEITLGTAARLADADRFEMRDIQREEGVELPDAYPKRWTDGAGFRSPARDFRRFLENG